MSYKSEIRDILKRHHIKSVTWMGALRMMGCRRRLDWDCDYVDTDGKTWCKREFVPGSKVKLACQRVEELLRKMHCKIGTTVSVQ